MPVLQLEKNCVRFFADFLADTRSEKRKITLVATFVDICFSLPRSIPDIAEKRTRKIAGTRSIKFVFYARSPQLHSTYHRPKVSSIYIMRYLRGLCSVNILGEILLPMWRLFYRCAPI